MAKIFWSTRGWAVCFCLTGVLNSAKAEEALCKQENEGFLTRFEYCSVSDGLPLRWERRFNSSQTLSSVIHFESGRPVRRQIFDIAGKQTGEIEILFKDNLHFYELTYSTGPLRGQVLGKSLYRIVNPSSIEARDQLLLERSRFIKDPDSPQAAPRYELKWVDTFDRGDTNLIQQRRVYNEAGEVESLFSFEVFEEDFFAGSLMRSIAKTSPGGDLVYRYKSETHLDPREILKQQGLPAEEFQRRWSILNNDQRRRILIIDSGIDPTDPDITYKLALNPKDPIDGIDNDGNGWVDDWVGQSYGIFGKGLSPRVSELPRVSHTDSHAEPFSHGAHVSTTALRDREEFALHVVSGDLTNFNLLMATSRFIKDHSIEFVNMSFSFLNQNNAFAPGSSSFFALERILVENPTTLFFVAAGNSFADIDESELTAEFPASHPYDNLIVVGALNTPHFAESEAHLYSPAHFSNRGIYSVDVFAPGDLVLANSIGGEEIPMSGTSMASPTAMNLALELAAHFPELNRGQIRDVIKFSAYIPNLQNPLPCSSGGMIFPRRARDVAWRVARLGQSPLTASLESRKEHFLQGEEEFSMNFPSASLELLNLWRERQLISNDELLLTLRNMAESDVSGVPRRQAASDLLSPN